MPVLKYTSIEPTLVRKGLERRLIHTSGLMTVIVDFQDGPWADPEPFHSHRHEQTSYVAEGELIFYGEGEVEQHLQAGDLFAVESGQKHTIQLLSPTARLIDSFCPIREEFLF